MKGQEYLGKVFIEKKDIAINTRFKEDIYNP